MTVSIQEHPTYDPDSYQFYVVSVFGNRVKTTVTSRARFVRKWISNIRRRHGWRCNRNMIVGLGVQWTPPSTTNRAATLQLCVGSQCLIFQLSQANSIPRALTMFLEDEGITFVGVRNHSDATILYRDYDLTVSRLVELARYVGSPGESMEGLAASYLGFHGVNKPEWVGRSDWDNWELDMDQVMYACVDAYLSFQIGKAVGAWN